VGEVPAVYSTQDKHDINPVNQKRSITTPAQIPGPDLACKDAVMESRAFMSSITVAYPHAVALSDKMRKKVSYEVIPHLCYSFSK